MKENFASFVMRHRFRLADIASHRPLSLHDHQLARVFPGGQLLCLDLKRHELERLGIAMTMAGYVAECQIDEPELFSQLASDLREDEWNYVLRFCPYQPVDSALRNLDLIVSALEEACIGLNAAKAGMETAMNYSRSRLQTHQREQSKATAQLLNFGALYASYVDVCRRIRRRCNLGDQKSYERAVARLVAKNIGAHSFAKDLRNYTLHFQIPEPYVTIELSENRKVSPSIE